MFLALLLSVAMADTLTLQSGARLTGDLATYEHGGNCYISVTDGELAGSIVVVMCDQISRFEKETPPLATVAPAAPDLSPPAQSVPEEVLPTSAPVEMQAMIAEESPMEELPMASAEPEAAPAALEPAPAVEPAMAEQAAEPPPAAPPAAPPSWRASPPPPVATGRVPSPSRSATVREPSSGGSGGASSGPPASAYSQPLGSEGNISR